MKRIFFCLAAACMALSAAAKEGDYKPQTVREEAQYLSTDPALVEDTCPGNDIFQRFTCTKNQPAGYSCFDVYRVQGDPISAERYTLLDQTITIEQTSAEPLCSFTDEMTCDNFLKALNFNLDFSWFIANFPSSSFPECGKTYTCTRIVCYFPPDKDAGQTASQKLSCVYKKHQRFFVGSEVTCTRTFKGQTLPPTPKKITQTASSLSL